MQCHIITGTNPAIQHHLPTKTCQPHPPPPNPLQLQPPRHPLPLRRPHPHQLPQPDVPHFTTTIFTSAREAIIDEMDAFPHRRYVLGTRVWQSGSTEVTLLPGPGLEYGDLVVLLAGTEGWGRGGGNGDGEGEGEGGVGVEFVGIGTG
ncbi:hypothetical protein G7Y79_00015g039150 [Physcia stellaris]|nr:hypothetical protein G7Y79_00015g039150 [Physcia stellaris]